MTGQRIAVIGLGYIGLPTAVCLAERGFDVIGVDVNDAAVARIAQGRSHIVEPGLDLALAAVVASGRLRATTAPCPADAFLIAVPTPVGHDAYRTPDLTFVEAATSAIAPHLEPGNLVVLESTSPVGTTERLAARIAVERPDLVAADGTLSVAVAYSPERVIPGRTMIELRQNDRVVGGVTLAAAARAAAIYATLTSGTIHQTDARTAEFVKLAENASRDVQIAFANELSMLCDARGIDVWEVIGLANRHPRVSILQPGPGVGGHCIAVDPWFIVAQDPATARIIRTAREVNDQKPEWVIAKVSAALDADPTARVACLGLTFKPDVDDFRESPSLAIARRLTAAYPGRVVCADPYADLLEDGELEIADAEDAVASAGVVVALVAHKAFAAIDYPAGKRVIDAPGLWRDASAPGVLKPYRTPASVPTVRSIAG